MRPRQSNRDTSGTPLIVASNRGPVEFRGESDAPKASRAPGGLASVVLAGLMGRRAHWIASAMTEPERQMAEGGGHLALGDALGEDARGIHLHYIAVEEERYRRYYDQVSSGALWFALHGLFDPPRRPIFDARQHALWEGDYKETNRRFASRVSDVLRSRAADSEAVVLIHDYHLFLVPRYLTGRGGPHRVAFFLHTPFPPPAGLAVLPASWARGILDGMLAADLVGFHSRRWLENFVACCREFLGAEDQPVSGSEAAAGIECSVGFEAKRAALGVFPVGPDAEKLRADASSEAVAAAAERLGVSDDDFVVVSVERADPAKNTLRSLRAIDELLETCEEARGKLRFLLCMNPSRERLAEYRSYVSECEALARAVNLKWQTRDWSPVTIEISDDYERSLAALRRYDVLLVNSLADGMNLVAREGPLVNERDGQLVLSRETGAFDIFGDAALAVNPFDVSEQAAAIEEAMRMPPASRRERARRLTELAASNDPASWIDAQVRAAMSLPIY